MGIQRGEGLAAVSIKQKLVSSALWLGVGNALVQLLSLLVFAILSRLLDPVEFGTVAFAAIFIEVLGVFAWAGVGDAIVRREDWDETFASTAFWVNILMGSALFVVLTFPVALTLEWVGYSGIQSILGVLSIVVLINCADSVISAQLKRKFAFRTIALRGLAANLAGGLLSVVLAFSGAGVWALVAQRVFAVSIQFVITLSTVRWVPKATFNAAYAWEMTAFASHVISAQLLNQLNIQAAPLLIGLFAGPVPLAIYRIGYRLLQSMTQLIIVPIQQPILSAFSRLDRSQRPRALLQTFKVTGLIVFPMYIGSSVVAPEIIALLFGPRWSESASVMAFLAFMVCASVVDYILAPVLTAFGQTRTLLKITFFTLLGTSLVALAVVKFGLNVVAASQAARAFVNSAMVIWFLRSILNVSLKDVVGAFSVSFIGASTMAAVLYALDLHYLDGFPEITKLLIIVPVGAAVYFLILLVLGGRSALSDISKMVLRR